MLQTENDRNDIAIDLLNQLQDQIFRVMAIAKEKQTNIECITYVDNNGNDSIAYVYDYKKIKLTNTKTFDKVAQEYYGNPDLGSLIAFYNKIQFEHNIPVGTEIKIPIISKQTQNQNNRIYASPKMQDNYGRDISLNTDGDFAVIRGDLAVVSGNNNLYQSITNRLTTAIGKRIRNGTYGIRATIGDTVAIDSYLFGSIEMTVKEDPRIEKIEEISIEGSGDALYININYKDINGNTDVIQEEI